MKPINILLILSLLLLGSCVDKDLNNDPTKSANLNPNFQLTGIELRQWGSMDIGSICNRYMSPLTQQMQGNWDATNYGGQYRNDDNAVNADGTPNTAHSLNPVPIVVVSDRVKSVHDGILADVAPTVLRLMGLEQPAEMTGKALVELK